MTHSTVTNEDVKSSLQDVRSIIQNESHRSVRSDMVLHDGQRSVSVLLTLEDDGIRYDIKTARTTPLCTTGTELSNALVTPKPTTKAEIVRELKEVLLQVGWSPSSILRMELNELARSFFFALIPGWVDTDVLNCEPQPEKEKQA